mmetsp:Transcript_4589/g.7777  ORF Transcript_4589/g.7777 Transcript_4589/m.7777 type:complete len:330 (-) Transcript_4589:145-1134(-)|eukprot:CAMPEP_0114429924 /NCGR_PEP_ID=MMETSP0103-20121206/9758_1 /TAXON_ID=37642 ORGANISM="Paraphysomonas imperforata, Strain PA2" /NCGR_SAMPLE_ID=MMETSP0103 /ASSEMBLY_ACC=CAM_ASM_000201 /LENGTH=329 /DNA_ID=CAMNT_0001599319 /DNA_START=88 /DNA_END=1077 /DNA_ORIENTATION=-
MGKKKGNRSKQKHQNAPVTNFNAVEKDKQISPGAVQPVSTSIEQSSDHHDRVGSSLTVGSSVSSSMEYFDVATPDASTIKSVISLVAREESISIEESPERQQHVNLLCADHCSDVVHSSSFSVVTESFCISTPVMDRDIAKSNGPGSDNQIDVTVDFKAADSTDLAVVEDNKAGTCTAARSVTASRQTFTELLLAACCFVALYPILHLQLLLVARFPSDVSTLSALPPSQPSTSSSNKTSPSHDLACVRGELVTLLRLAWSIAINQTVEAPVVKAALGLPYSATSDWTTKTLCRLVWLSFLPLRVTCRALLVPLCVTMLPAQQAPVPQS